MEIVSVLQNLYIDPLLEEIDHHFTGPLPAQISFGVGGAIHHDEGRVLASFAARSGGPVLELGSDHGVSTRYIHQGLKVYADSPLYRSQNSCDKHVVVAIDRHHKWEDDDTWPRRVRVVADTYHLTPCGIRKLIPADFGPYVWAFIDACHSYEAVMRDTLLALLVGVSDIFYHDCNKNTIPPYNPDGDKGSGAYDAAHDVFTDEPTWKLTYIETFCGMIHAARVR